jgi:hypothetical protein
MPVFHAAAMKRTFLKRWIGKYGSRPFLEIQISYAGRTKKRTTPPIAMVVMTWTDFHG